MAPEGGHVLAIDVGTSGTRVSAVTLTGEILASAHADPRAVLAGDRATLDPERLWLDVAGLIRDTVARNGAPQAIAVACQLGTVFVDRALHPVAPALLWQDRRAEDEASELTRALGDTARVAGRLPAAELAGPRAMWFARHEPVAWERTAHVLALKDFLVARLTGSVSTDVTSASYTSLFDVRRRAWSDAIARAATVPLDRLPRALSGHEIAGEIPESVAREIGVRAGVPVAAGGPDGTVAALGTGAVAPGVTVDIAGTTDVLLSVTDRAIEDRRARAILNAHLAPGFWTIGGPTGMTGGAIAWLSNALGYASIGDAYAALTADVDRIAPGADGVVFFTTLTGERFPTWEARRAGAIHGLGPEHGRAHLLRAAEEGAAFVVREGIEALAALGIKVSEIRVSGGVTRSARSIQLRADAWRRPVVVASNAAAATTIGAAMLAAVAAGAYADVATSAAALVRLDRPVHPEVGAADAYDAAYAHWRSFRAS